MNKRYIFIALLSSVLALGSCSDYLEIDNKVNTYLDYETVFKDKYAAPGFLNHAYTYLKSGYYYAGDAMLASASDEAKHSESGSLIHLFNNSAIGPTVNPDDIWKDMYSGIRVCNIFLHELRPEGLIPTYNSIPESSRENFMGQAYFLRAFFHFELLKRYQNIFYVDKPLDIFNEGELFDIPQISFHEAVEKIASDCEAAFTYLPDKVQTSELGRPSKAAPLALLSRLHLYAASPLNNPTNNVELWKKAEEAAKELYSKASSYGISLMSAGSYASIFTTPYNQEIIFASMAELTNKIEQNNYPISYQGKGLTNPTQDLIDDYACASTGYDSPRPDDKFDPQNPYVNMEARFHATILYNNAMYKGVPVETFVGGKDGLNSTTTATKTGYYMRKFMYQGLDLSKDQADRHYWIFFRYAEILLNYAEARNEVLDAPDKTIHDILNLIRNRSGLRPFRGNATYPYITDKNEMREYIKLERRKELALEEHRFWDLRRWKDEAALKKAVTGMRVERTQTGVDEEGKPIYSFSYQKFEVEKRSFDSRFYWYPIPRREILKYQNVGVTLQQNPGW